MLIFGGWGSVVAMVAGVAWMGLSQALFGPGRILGFFTLLFGVALAAFGQFLHLNDVEAVIDPATGREQQVRHRHHLFWISVRWWGLLIGLAGVSTLVFGASQ